MNISTISILFIALAWLAACIAIIGLSRRVLSLERRLTNLTGYLDSLTFTWLQIQLAASSKESK